MEQVPLGPLPLARLVAQSAVSTPGVVALHGGEVGEVATYWQGQRVPGVRVYLDAPPRVAVWVVAALGRPLQELADDVRQRIHEVLARATQLDNVRVDVHVVGLNTPVDPP